MPRPLRTSFTVLLSAVVFTMMTITSVDVAGRYLLNMPLPGTQEMTELLLALLVFGAAPLVSADRTHITTDILESSIKGVVRTIRDISVGLVSCLACAVLAWRIWVQATSMSALSGHTPLLGIPVGPLLYFSAVMCLACAALSLMQAASASFHAWRT
jgi:TRAP-type C4-dicarboxylate transport system permease small subunit